MKTIIKKSHNGFWLMLLALAMTIASCSPFQVKSDFAETANFTTYKTYKLRVDDLKLNDIDKDRVLNEVSKQLKMKGLTVADNPDLIINVKASHKKVRDIQSTRPYGMWGWGGSWGWGFGVNRTWTNNYNSGILAVDMVDSKTQKLIWQGIGEGLAVDSPKAKQKEIPQIVAEIMANYPPKQGK